MKNDRRLKMICFIPYVSTIIILFVTMFNLRRKEAPYSKWVRFDLTFVLTGGILYVINNIFAKINAPVIHMIISILVLTIANLIFIRLQCCAPTHAEEKKQTMGFVNIKSVIIIAMIGTVLSIIVVYICFADDSSTYTDLNGIADTSLSHITLDEILTTVGDYSATKVEHSCKGEHTLVPKSLNSSDYDIIVFRCEQISGIRTLQTTKISQNTVSLIVDSKIKSGNMEIIILVDNEYYCHIATDCQQTVELNNIAGKTIMVRMAAESAEVELTVTRAYK